jgi:hypothetical protein
MNRLTRAAAGAALALLVGVAACDSGPSGPGTLAVTVSSPVPISAAVVSLEGKGIRAVRATSGEAVGRETGNATTPGYRFAVFGEGTNLTVQVEVDDVASLPSGFVTQAADAEGRLIGSAGIEVRIER